MRKEPFGKISYDLKWQLQQISKKKKLTLEQVIRFLLERWEKSSEGIEEKNKGGIKGDK